MTRPKHGAALVDTVINDEEVVVPGKRMFGLEVHFSLLRHGADLITAFNKASILYNQSVDVQHSGETACDIPSSRLLPFALGPTDHDFH